MLQKLEIINYKVEHQKYFYAVRANSSDSKAACWQSFQFSYIIGKQLSSKYLGLIYLYFTPTFLNNCVYLYI